MEDNMSGTQQVQEQEQQNQQDQTSEQEKHERQHNQKLPTKFHFRKMRLWLGSKFSVSSALKALAFLAIVLWAYRGGLFDQVPGVKELLEVGLNVGNEICGFIADLLLKLYELLHIEDIWHFIRSLVQ